MQGCWEAFDPARHRVAPVRTNLHGRTPGSGLFDRDNSIAAMTRQAVETRHPYVTYG
jgi:hypothetical protein